MFSLKCFQLRFFIFFDYKIVLFFSQQNQDKVTEKSSVFYNTKNTKIFE